MQQDFDYSEDSPADQSSIVKRDTVLSRFMPTSRRLVQFSDGNVADPNATIVYIDGAFDLFHVGHIEILKVSPKLFMFTYLNCGSPWRLRYVVHCVQWE